MLSDFIRKGRANRVESWSRKLDETRVIETDKWSDHHIPITLKLANNKTQCWFFFLLFTSTLLFTGKIVLRKLFVYDQYNFSTPKLSSCINHYCIIVSFSFFDSLFYSKQKWYGDLYDNENFVTQWEVWVDMYNIATMLLRT